MRLSHGINTMRLSHKIVTEFMFLTHEIAIAKVDRLVLAHIPFSLAERPPRNSFNLFRCYPGDEPTHTAIHEFLSETLCEK